MGLARQSAREVGARQSRFVREGYWLRAPEPEDDAFLAISGRRMRASSDARRRTDDPPIRKVLVQEGARVARFSGLGGSQVAVRGVGYANQVGVAGVPLRPRSSHRGEIDRGLAPLQAARGRGPFTV